MSVEYKGLMRGNHSPIAIAKMISDIYGGERFSVDICDWDGFYRICFKERATAEQMKMRLWDRAKVLLDRQMAVFTDGDCACDYAELTSEPMTIISLGRHGDCEEIINGLVAKFGGWIMDEAGDQEWHPYGITEPATPTLSASAAS